MPKRALSNKLIQVLVGPRSMVADPSAPTEAECASLLHISAAVRWNGLDFGMQASDKVDDRSLDDDASAQLRGFAQYGGGVPVFFPKITDTGSILRKAFTLFREQGTELIWIERVGWGTTSDEVVGGDNVNSYVIVTDGFKPDAEGDGGYAYILTMLAQGLAFPWTIVAENSPSPVTIDGAATRNVAVDGTTLLRAHYLGNDVTKRATWRSSDDTVVRVEKGILVGEKAGTATIYADFAGATETSLSVTAA